MAYEGLPGGKVLPSIQLPLLSPEQVACHEVNLGYEDRAAGSTSRQEGTKGCPALGAPARISHQLSLFRELALWVLGIEASEQRSEELTVQRGPHWQLLGP